MLLTLRWRDVVAQLAREQAWARTAQVDDCIAFTELTVRHTGTAYVAAVRTSTAFTVDGTDVLDSVRKSAEEEVASKPASRFRRDRFEAFAHEQLARFEAGEI